MRLGLSLNIHMINFYTYFGTIPGGNYGSAATRRRTIPVGGGGLAPGRHALYVTSGAVVD